MPVGLHLYDKNGILSFDASAMNSILILEHNVSLPNYRDKTFWNPNITIYGGKLYSIKAIPSAYSLYKPSNSFCYVFATYPASASTLHPVVIDSNLKIQSYKDAPFIAGSVSPSEYPNMNLLIYTYKGVQEGNIIV